MSMYMLSVKSPHQPLRIGSGDEEEVRMVIPADQGITDFGPLPRDRYPLVAVLTLAEPEAREAYNIVSPSNEMILTLLNDVLLTTLEENYALK